MKPVPALMLLLAAAIHTAALATSQTVWRCGPDGRSYESQPCKDGRALQLPGAQQPADVLAAQRVAEADQRLAQQMRNERLQRERELMARGPGLAGFGHAAPVGDLKSRQVRQSASKSKAKPSSAQVSQVRQARSPEAAGTSPRVARVSPRKPG